MSMGGGGGGNSSGRPSLAGGSSNGTGSGTGASTSNSVVKQDPRPIQDKNYQQHCIRTLLMFLTKSGYEYPVNLKSLVRPSGKDFTHIVTFLLKQVDPTFGTTDLKMEEEVAMHFKALGYPYPVSKTALVAAGSPHTWPSLLAALVWLVEHIVVLNVSVEEEAEVNYETSAKFESLAELETKTDKAFFQYLHRAYAAFLEGSVEKSDLLVENLVDMFEEDNNVIEREIERVTDLNATMVEKIHLLQQQSERYVPPYSCRFVCVPVILDSIHFETFGSSI
jgi:kinetochore protein NDC80